MLTANGEISVKSEANFSCRVLRGETPNYRSKAVAKGLLMTVF